MHWGIYLSDLGKTWQLGFCLAPEDQSPLEKRRGLGVVVGTAGYPRDCPNSGCVDQVLGSKLVGRGGALLAQPLQSAAVFTRGFNWQVPCSSFALASWIRPMLTMIIMIIAELRGRLRQSPIVPGGECQSLGTKNRLSAGPVNTHWSHVYINSGRYTLSSMHNLRLSPTTFVFCETKVVT